MAVRDDRTRCPNWYNRRLFLLGGPHDQDLLSDPNELCAGLEAFVAGHVGLDIVGNIFELSNYLACSSHPTFTSPLRR